MQKKELEIGETYGVRIIERRLPKQFEPGTKVRDIYTGKISTVRRAYWQQYAGGDTSDYTVEFVEYGWNKSTNLEEVPAQ